MSGTNNASRLIELTSARLCRDISGLVESLGHAALASANGSAHAPELDKAEPETDQALSVRLELRRAAWGPNNQPLSLERMQLLARGMPEWVTIDSAALSDNIVFPATTGRIVLNLLLLAADSLPAGGTIVLAGAVGDLFVRIVGSAAAWPTGLALCLADEAEARSALAEGRNLQMALTALLTHAAGIRVSVLLSPTAEDVPAILRLGG